MNAPLRQFPLSLRLILIFCMWLVNLKVLVYLALMLVPILFGIDKPESVVANIPQTANQLNAFLFIQAASSLGFLLTAVMFSKLEAFSAREHLKLIGLPAIKVLGMAVFATLVAQFFIEFMVTVNSKIPLPTWLSFLKDYEKQLEEMTNAILNFKSFNQFISISIVLGLLPALCEEFFFRGLLLGDFLKNKINPYWSITITGLLFALFHAEFQNTIAIWLLGAFLGYLYYVSGSIWPSVAAHFTNNMLQIIFKYLYNTGIIKSNVADEPTPYYITIIAILIFAGCIFLLSKWKKPGEVEAEPEIPETDVPG
jgi:membrane protease YdiL (CAAX protease family)